MMAAAFKNDTPSYSGPTCAPYTSCRMDVKYSRTHGWPLEGSCDQSPASLLYMVVRSTGTPGTLTESAVR